MTDSDELPLQVEIEAEGEDLGGELFRYISVKLDKEESQVRVELETKTEPVIKTASVGTTPFQQETVAYTYKAASRVSAGRKVALLVSDIAALVTM